MSSTLEQATAKFDRLRRQISFFIGDKRDGRSSVGQLLQQLSGFGEVAIVGGMLRDLLLHKSYAKFTSDVDIVLDADDTPELRQLLTKLGAQKNRFGGYALDTEWQADIWLLGQTWAKVAGHREVTRIEDIAHTTFFNWDAILYSFNKKSFVYNCKYLDHISDRYLDINLKENPNRIGSCVRTLRAALNWGAVLSPSLAAFTAEVIEDVGPNAILQAEKKSFADRSVLTGRIISEAIQLYGVEHRDGIMRPLPSSYRHLQWKLSFEDVSGHPEKQVTRGRKVSQQLRAAYEIADSPA